MQKLFFPTLAAALLAGQPLSAQPAPAETGQPSETTPVDQASVSMARQIVERSFPPETREQMLHATMDQMLAQMNIAMESSNPDMDEGARAIVQRWQNDYVSKGKVILNAHLPAMMDALAISYARIFTHEELSDILAFVSTPSGQRFMEMSQAVVAAPEFAQANQDYMNEVLAGLPAAQAKLMDELMEYYQSKEAVQATEPT